MPRAARGTPTLATAVRRTWQAAVAAPRVPCPASLNAPAPWRNQIQRSTPRAPFLRRRRQQLGVKRGKDRIEAALGAVGLGEVGPGLAGDQARGAVGGGAAGEPTGPCPARARHVAVGMGHHRALSRSSTPCPGPSSLAASRRLASKVKSRDCPKALRDGVLTGTSVPDGIRTDCVLAVTVARIYCFLTSHPSFGKRSCLPS